MQPQPPTQEQDFAVLLFMLPENPERAQEVQDHFLCSRDFWDRWRPHMQAWTELIGVSKTETPDGKPALALLLKPSPIDTLFYEVGHNIAEELECPAYTLLYTSLGPDELTDLQATPAPWS